MRRLVEYPLVAVAALFFWGMMAWGAGTSLVSPVQTITCSASNWVNSLAGTGVFGCARPASTDLSDASSLAYLAGNAPFTEGQAVTPVDDGTQSAGGTLTMSFAASNNHLATFGAGNLTIANPTGVHAGECGFLALTQDGVGGRTVSWGGNWKWNNATAPTLSTAAGATDLITWCTVTTSVIAAQLAIAAYQ